ncbi:MAG TPA: LysM peptidoglycan-binding domain-containing protein, partial [Chloroflexota bacterium]
MRNLWRQHPRSIAAATLGVLVLVSLAGVGGVALTSRGVLHLPYTSQTPPQAAASAPEPTLISVEATAQATEALGQATPGSTPEPSAFAGIAEPPPQPPPRTGLVHHTVTEGEVLWQIAEQYNLRPETVLWANDIQDPDLLLIGQDLVIPPTDGVLYTVRSGDRLVDVADRYGVDLQAVI